VVRLTDVVLVGVAPDDGVCVLMTAPEYGGVAVGAAKLVVVGEGVIARVALGEGLGVDVVTVGDGVLVAVGEGVSVAVGDGVLVAVGDGVSVSVSSRTTCPLIVLPLAGSNPVLAYAEVVYRKMHIKEQQTKETASIQAM
jgi:hypothetical protein